jgi:uncharacterized protein
VTRARTQPRPADAAPGNGGAHRSGAAKEVRRGERVWVDYSHELRMARSPLERYLYRALGLVCVVFAAIGVVMPAWPTTPFVLLATFFFARSSPRFYNWIMNHRTFGPLIRDWRDGRGIPARAKVIAVASIVLSIGISITLIPVPWVRVLLLVIAVSVSTYLLRLPTTPPSVDDHQLHQGGTGPVDRLGGDDPDDDGT